LEELLKESKTDRKNEVPTILPGGERNGDLSNNTQRSERKITGGFGENKYSISTLH